MSTTTADPLVRWQRRCAIVALAAGFAWALGAVRDPTEALRAWLCAFLCFLAFPLGSLAILLTHDLTGGRWGAALRPVLQSALWTLPLFVLIFVPLALGVEWLYPWTDTAHVAHDPILRQKAAYLNTPFFIIRSGSYFAVWLLLMLFARRRHVSALGLILYVVTVSFAGIDWIMSLEPHWFSTAFGLVYISAQVLPAFAMAIVWTTILRPTTSFEVWNDLGNLLLALVMMWAYIAFSQFFLIWAGNLPEEIVWYLHRSEGLWKWLARALIVVYFFLPFLLLLSRNLKRNPRQLTMVAALVLVMHAVYHYWLVRPSFVPEGHAHSEVVVAAPHWLDLPAFLAIGGTWLAVFAGHLRRVPLEENHG